MHKHVTSYVVDYSYSYSIKCGKETIFYLAFKHSMLTLDNNLTKDAFIMIHKILSNQNLVLATKLQLQ